jgi:hypothetical protein
MMTYHITPACSSYRVQVHVPNQLPLILAYHITQTSHHVQSSAMLTYRSTFHVTHITTLALKYSYIALKLTYHFMSNHDDIPHHTSIFQISRSSAWAKSTPSHPTPNLILTYHTFHVTHITSLALKYFNVALKLTYHFMSNHHTRYRVQVHGSNHLPLILTYRITQTSHYVQSSALLTYRTTFHVTHITMLSLSNHDDIPHHTSNLIMTYHSTFHVTHVTMLSRCNGAILTFCSS